MRLVALADTHSLHDKLPPLPAGDVLIHAGDLSATGNRSQLHEVAAWLRSLPYAHKILIAGNHDIGFEFANEATRAIFEPDLHYLQDSAYLIDRVKFYGSPWQPEFGNWAFNLPRGPKLAEKWAQIPPDTDILITHGPPYGIGDEVGRGNCQGCQELRTAVYRLGPKLHLFGHIHEMPGCWLDAGIYFSNVNTQMSQRSASVFDLDPDTKTITPILIPPPAVRGQVNKIN